MGKIAILYGSSGGNTESVVKRLQSMLGDTDIFNVDSVSIDEIESYPNLILGTSTNGIGELQDDWDSFLPTFEGMDLSGKTVAIFGLGDGASFPDSFAGSMKILFDAVSGKAKVIGAVADEGYSYSDSQAVVNGKWVGLPIDEDNEYDETESRLINWVAAIRSELA